MNEMDFAGKWRVTKALGLVKDYLSLTPDPHVQFTVKNKKEVDGSYHFGAQDGYMDGRFETDKEGNLQLMFSFEGSDETTEVSGCGTATLGSQDTLLLKMHYHMGNTSTFICKRN